MLEPIQLQRLDLPTGRVYVTPEGNKYPSVTTVISKNSDDSWLKKWKERVGEEEANRVSKRATQRGTRLHALCEDYVQNKPVTPSIFDLDAWNRFKPVFSNVDNIRLVEGQLYSDVLKMSGTTDLVADYAGKLSIIDYKTSRRLKREEDIQDYFIQSTAYGLMLLERYGLKVEQIVILMSVDDENPQIFIKSPKQYVPKLAEYKKRFDSLQKT